MLFERIVDEFFNDEVLWTVSGYFYGDNLGGIYAGHTLCGSR